MVEREVAAKKGLSGAAIKTGYKVSRSVRPNLVRDVLGSLLPEFATALQPWVDRSHSADGDAEASFRQVLLEDSDAVAEALLGVTDQRAEGANEVLRKTYARLRKGAKAQVQAAVPNVADTLAPFVGQMGDSASSS